MTTQSIHVHINRGTNVHYVVVGVMRGCRKTILIKKSRSKVAAIRKAAEKMATGEYRKIWINHCADYYDPITFVKMEAV